ncbi:MAG: PPOX class F420-dependent oxidoreductase [Acidimicrobiales bacterium]
MTGTPAIEAAVDFIRSNHRGVLLTYGHDGSPQMSPVVAGVDGCGCVVVSTREATVKARNLLRNPHASACIFSNAFFGPWAGVDMTVEVVPLPAAMDDLVALYRQVAGEHPDWAGFEEAMRTERRVLLRGRPGRASVQP